MGGHAFPKLHVPRMSPAEYEKLRDECIQILKSFYTQVMCPSESPEKADHGDVDFLVADPILSNLSSDRLMHALGAIAQIGKSPKSFAVPLHREGTTTSYAQIDVELCGRETLSWVSWMNAYGDLSQIIGILLAPSDLRMSGKGLSVAMRFSNLEPHPIF